MLPLDKGSGIYHIGKHAGRTAKYVIFDNYIVIYLYVVLYLYSVPDKRPGTDVHILTDGTSFADLRAGHDMAKMPYFCAFANLRALVHITGFMDKIGIVVTHAFLFVPMGCNTQEPAFRRGRFMAVKRY
jgi:hypothetical protein